MNEWTGEGINFINNIADEIVRQQREHKERTLAEIIEKYDFIVGSTECKHTLMEILPEGANITCTPYIESPTMIYAIKKFDIRDLLFKPQESEFFERYKFRELTITRTSYITGGCLDLCQNCSDELQEWLRMAKRHKKVRISNDNFNRILLRAYMVGI